MNANPSRTPSFAVRLLRGVGVAISLLGVLVLGLKLNSTGVERESPLLIGLGLLLSIGSFILGLILGLRAVARWERRGAAEAAAYADQLVCSACGVFPRDKGIAGAPSRARRAVNVTAGFVVVFVLVSAVMSGLDRRSLGAGFAVVLLGTAISRWAKAPRFACPTCKGNSVVARNSAKGARWAAQFDGPEVIE